MQALARKKINGQSFLVNTDSEGNVTNVQVQSSALSTRSQGTGSSRHDQTSAMDQDEDSTDDELFSQPITRARGKRASRATRCRDRSIVRGNTTRKSAYPYPQPTAALTSESDDEPPIPPRKQHKSFQIQDEQAVKDFLHSRLKGMQQLADKKIAKAWIKSICPKKQANFPYQNKKTGSDGRVREQPPKVPGWWPDTEACRFIEPDHIKRTGKSRGHWCSLVQSADTSTERMDLCLHLLRLRPDPEQLRIWNEDKTEPNPIHEYQGWTAFLKDSAGAEIFDELPKEDKVRTEKRKYLMEQMYDVAQFEQDFLDGGVGEYLLCLVFPIFQY